MKARMGRDEVTQFVEQSDCVLVLGAFMTDLNLGIFTANLDPGKCVYATSEQLQIRHHNYHDVLLEDFMEGLVAARLKAEPQALPPPPALVGASFELRPEAPITIGRLVARLNQSLDSSTVVIADVGDAPVRLRRTGHSASRPSSSVRAYYTSMGFAAPAVLGAMTARPDLRAVALIGDGAFQMTGLELSNVVRRGLDPIVIVLDNGGLWHRAIAAPAVRTRSTKSTPGTTTVCPSCSEADAATRFRTEAEFDAALRAAWADRSGMSLIHVYLDRDDCSKGPSIGSAAASAHASETDARNTIRTDKKIRPTALLSCQRFPVWTYEEDRLPGLPAPVRCGRRASRPGKRIRARARYRF